MPVLNDAARQVITGGNLAHIVTLDEDGSAERRLHLDRHGR